MIEDRGLTPLETLGKYQKDLRSLTGFTLIELIIVIIIVGVLATLALTQYGSYRESTLDREAQANLKLIIAAERIYRMEIGGYYPWSPGTISDIAAINTNLRLSLSETYWDYSTKSTGGPPSTSACAQATRSGRNFSLLNTQEDPDAVVCP